MARYAARPPAYFAARLSLRTTRELNRITTAIRHLGRPTANFDPRTPSRRVRDGELMVPQVRASPPRQQLHEPDVTLRLGDHEIQALAVRRKLATRRRACRIVEANERARCPGAVGARSRT